MRAALPELAAHAYELDCPLHADEETAAAQGQVRALLG
jgi:hypothetical protein